MKKGKKLYEGKAKIIYATSDKNLVIQHFKDDATAFNNKKRAKIDGKGILNNRISEHILKNLGQVGIKNHLVKRLNMREQLVHKLEIIPIEVVIRNIATGSLVKRLGIEEGKILSRPIIEFYLKNDELNDPIISEEHIIVFDWASHEELESIISISQRINDFLTGYFYSQKIRLVDFIPAISVIAGSSFNLDNRVQYDDLFYKSKLPLHPDLLNDNIIRRNNFYRSLICF